MQSTQLTHWEQLPGRTVREVSRTEKTVRIGFDDGYVEFRAKDADLPVLAERPAANGTTMDLDLSTLVGKRIGGVLAPYFAEGFSQKSTATVIFDDNEQLVLRAQVSFSPVVIG